MIADIGLSLGEIGIGALLGLVFVLALLVVTSSRHR